MNTIKHLILLAVVSVALSFTACGGGDSSSLDGDGSSSGGNTPIVAYTCEDTLTVAGQTMVMKLGANGNLACDNSGVYRQLVFANGINGMEIQQLTSTKVFNSNTTGSGTTTTDLQAGTERLQGTHPDHGSVDCVNTYDVPTPLSVYNPEDLEGFYLDGYQLIDTTCPDWVNDDEDGNDEDDYYGNMTLTENTIITETSGTVSKLSTYTAISQ